MNKIKKTFLMPVSLFVVLTGILGACSESWLDLTPQGALSQSSLGTKAGVEATLIGAYSLLDGYHIDNNNTWPADPVNWIMGSVPSDDAYKGSEQGDLGEITLLELFQWAPGNSLLKDKYIPLYEGVTRSNAVINLVKSTTGIDDIKDRVMGEALFLRAYYHFELYKVFGHIVYMNEDDSKNLNFYKPNETDANNVLALIAADLTSAIAVLPSTQSDKGRVTKAAAQAFLGKVYMYKLEYANAKTQFDAVLAAVPVTNLANCQRDLFTYGTENGPEALFSVQMSLSNAAQARNSNWLNQLANPVGGGFGCCGFHQPSQNLVNAFKVDATDHLPLLDTWNAADLNPATDLVDPRLDLTVGRDNVPYWDWAVHNAGFIRSLSYSGPYSPKKFQPYSTSPIVAGGWNGAANNGVNVPVIRLADVVLLLAEAEIEVGSLARAQQLVNYIRTRAGNCSQGTFSAGAAAGVMAYPMTDQAFANYEVGLYGSAGTNTFATQGQAYARKAVRFERRLELALEGNRFFDLRRWDDMAPGYAATVLNAFVTVEKTKRAYYTEAESFATKHRWYPLPTSQVELSYQNGQPTLTQNDGF